MSDPKGELPTYAEWKRFDATVTKRIRELEAQVAKLREDKAIIDSLESTMKSNLSSQIMLNWSEGAFYVDLCQTDKDGVAPDLRDAINAATKGQGDDT